MAVETEKYGDEMYKRLKEKLLEKVISGVFAPGERFHSVRDVAQWPGATVHLAQRALQDMCKEGYLESVPKRGCFVRSHANRVRTNNRHDPWKVLLVVVNPGTNRVRFDEMLPAVANNFNSDTWRMEVYYLKDNYLEEGGFQFSQSVISRHPTAILWMMPRQENKLLVRSFVSAGIPVVTYNRDFTDAGALGVVCDVSGVAGDLFRVVWGAGKRRMVIFSIDRDSPSIQQFPNAALEAARQVGVDDGVEHILLPFREPEGNHSVEGEMFAKVNAVMSQPNRPDGVLCGESFSLKCVEMWLSQNRDVRVPQDLVVASFDRQIQDNVVRILPTVPCGNMDHDAMARQVYEFVELELAGKRVEPKLKGISAILCNSETSRHLALR